MFKIAAFIILIFLSCKNLETVKHENNFKDSIIKDYLKIADPSFPFTTRLILIIKY